MLKTIGIIFILLFSLASPVYGQALDASQNPDLNLSIRGWQQITNPPYGGFGLIDVSGPTDPNAPSLATLIQGNSTPNFTSLYQVYGWDWATNQKTVPIPADYSNNWGVTLAGLSTNPGDTIQVPASGYDIGGGNQVLVLYASPTSITLNYTLSGSVASGYTIQLENFNVDPAIVALYNQANAAGRTQLPALPAFAALGKASGKEILVAIRDTGSFMDPRSRKDWWQARNGNSITVPPQLVNTTQSQSAPGVSSGALKSFPEESEEPCTQTDIAGGAGGNPTYNKSGGGSEQVFKNDIGLNFSTAVKGTHCGQTKSQPLVLTETAPFNLSSDPKCKTVQWLGEIKISDDNTSNFTLPFAQEIANHWAGTGFEYTGFGALSFLSGQQGSAMPANIGVLQKLLGQGNQDALKCSFINYVKKKGSLSAYAGAKVESGLLVAEKKLVDISCPPSVGGNYDAAANQNWRNVWGEAWSKIGLFPDEKSRGVLRFAVCADKMYDVDTGYPSVFKLGLAANELFKLFTAKERQDSYFQANGDTSGLAKPLDQNKSLAQKPSLPNNLPFLDKILERLKSFVSTVFAQGTGTITVTPRAEIVDGRLVYSVEITLPSGVDGHVNVEVVGTGKGTVNYVPVGGTIYLGTPGSGATAIIDGWPLLNPGDTVTFQVKCDDCKSKDQGQPILMSCTSTISGQTSCKPLGVAPPLPPACGPDQCCETKECSTNCRICNLAQKNPSDTTVWPQGYSYNRFPVGNPQVDLTFKIPDWQPGQPLPAGCTLVNKCAPTNYKCIANAEYCDPISGICGDIKCEKTHTRVVDLFNKVPFLSSVWKQSADQASGFLNIFKSGALNGVGLRSNIIGCTTDTNLVLDPSGNFGTNPAYSDVGYKFDQNSSQTVGNVTVSLSSPGSGEKGKITFYRLGGVCNADKWVSQRVLYP